MSSALFAAKAAMRKNVKEVLKNMTPEDRERQSKAIFNKLIQTKEWLKASRISCYLSTPEEVQTDPIVKEAISHGKKCFIPYTVGNHMMMLGLKDQEDINELPKDSWGIRLPKPVEGREDAMETGGVDLVIVPGVAFTKSGKRLGHGKGYYDGFIHELRQLPHNPKTIAVAFRQQIFEDVPTGPNDQNIDQLLTVD